MVLWEAAQRLKPLMSELSPLPQQTRDTASPHGPARSVAVIGAGIVGVASAVFLQKAGHRVTLWDPRGPAGGASYGNAGIVEASSCLPIATPGILRDIPSMLMDKDGPVIIRPGYFPKALPWLLRLVLATRWSKIERTAQALLSLSRNAIPAYDALFGIVPVDGVMHDVGRLSVYSTEAGFAGGAASRRFATEHGMTLDILDRAAIHDLEPHLAPLFSRAAFDLIESICLFKSAFV